MIAQMANHMARTVCSRSWIFRPPSSHPPLYFGMANIKYWFIVAWKTPHIGPMVYLYMSEGLGWIPDTTQTNNREKKRERKIHILFSHKCMWKYIPNSIYWCYLDVWFITCNMGYRWFVIMCNFIIILFAVL